jgi:hypothetical protein
MAKAMCECCGDYEADASLAGDVGASYGLGGRRYRFECLLTIGLETMCNRIRTRRCVDCGSSDNSWNYADKRGSVTTSLCRPCCDKRQAAEKQPSDTIPAPPLAAPECRECSRPERPIAATHGELCVYCNHALAGAKRGKLFEQRETANAHVILYANGSEDDKGARARLAAADRKATPRATAESRMLALPHPWECDDV